MELNAIGLRFDSIKHAQWDIHVCNILPREVHKVSHEHTTDGPVTYNEEVIRDALNLAHHVPQPANNLEITLAANARVDVVELVLRALLVFLGMVLSNLRIGHALELTGIQLVEHLPVLDVIVIVRIKVLGSFDAALQHRRPNTEVLLVEIAV